MGEGVGRCVYINIRTNALVDVHVKHRYEAASMLYINTEIIIFTMICVHLIVSFGQPPCPPNPLLPHHH